MKNSYAGKFSEKKISRLLPYLNYKLTPHDEEHTHNTHPAPGTDIRLTATIQPNYLPPSPPKKNKLYLPTAATMESTWSSSTAAAAVILLLGTGATRSHTGDARGATTEAGLDRTDRQRGLGFGLGLGLRLGLGLGHGFELRL